MSTRGKKTGPSALLLIFIGVVALLAGWTAMNFRGGHADEKNMKDRHEATATVSQCEEVGPISLSGVGYWWSCLATITPEEGKAYEQTFNGSQFRPEDEGGDFPMVSAGRSSNSWSRADVPGNSWATVATAAGLIIGAICLALGIRGIVRRY